MKKQVVVIHGAGAFARLERDNFIEALRREEIDLKWYTRGGGDWKAHLGEHLGDAYEVFTPKMPDPDHPLYEAWEIWFEKILSKLGNDIILVGHSLGGAFLLKFLSERQTEKRVSGLFIVAAPLLEGARYEARGFSRPQDVSGIKNIPRVFFYYSADDAIVPLENLTVFQELFPAATFRTLQGRGHFNKDDFPEIVNDIENL